MKLTGLEPFQRGPKMSTLEDAQRLVRDIDDWHSLGLAIAFRAGDKVTNIAEAEAVLRAPESPWKGPINKVDELNYPCPSEKRNAFDTVCGPTALQSTTEAS